MNIVNPNQFEKLSEKLLRILLSNIKGTPEHASKILKDAIDYMIKK